MHRTDHHHPLNLHLRRRHHHPHRGGLRPARTRQETTRRAQCHSRHRPRRHHPITGKQERQRRKHHTPPPPPSERSITSAIRSTSPPPHRANHRRSAISLASAASRASCACSSPRFAWAIAWSASARSDLRWRMRRSHIGHPPTELLQQFGVALRGSHCGIRAFGLHSQRPPQLVHFFAGCFPCFVPLSRFGLHPFGVGLGRD